MKSEIVIVKNPLLYQDASPEAFKELMNDGSWIPLVFQCVESVVNRYFFELCEIDWDYCRDTDELEKSHENYKTVYFKNLTDEQRCFVKKVADEIEQEIIDSARNALAARAENEEE